jgi:hypothetical protein
MQISYDAWAAFWKGAYHFGALLPMGAGRMIYSYIGGTSVDIKNHTASVSANLWKKEHGRVDLIM